MTQKFAPTSHLPFIWRRDKIVKQLGYSLQNDNTLLWRFLVQQLFTVMLFRVYVKETTVKQLSKVMHCTVLSVHHLDWQECDIYRNASSEWLHWFACAIPVERVFITRYTLTKTSCSMLYVLHVKYIVLYIVLMLIYCINRLHDSWLLYPYISLNAFIAFYPLVIYLYWTVFYLVIFIY